MVDDLPGDALRFGKNVKAATILQAYWGQSDRSATEVEASAIHPRARPSGMTSASSVAADNDVGLVLKEVVKRLGSLEDRIGSDQTVTRPAKGTSSKASNLVGGLLGAQSAWASSAPSSLLATSTGS